MSVVYYYMPVMLKKEKQLSPFEQKLNAWVEDHLTRIPFVQKIFFVDHLKTMIHAGISLVEALDILSKEMENKKFKRIIIQVKEAVEQGLSFSEVLKRFPSAFPPIYVSMIAAGETAGTLEESLEQVVIQMQKSHELASSIRGAMIYPSVVLTAMGGIGVMMVTVVLPRLIVIFEEFDAELPLATRILIAITNFVSNPVYFVLCVVVIIAMIALFFFLLKRSSAFKKGFHSLLLRLPIVGPVIKKINLATFSLTLSSMLKSTIPVVDALHITADTCGNVRYKEALHTTASSIKSGSPLSETLRQYDTLFPPMVTEMVMVGERSGEVDHLLTELSHFYSREVEKTMKNFTTIIEPVIILALGLAVAGMAVAVIMPMYSLVQNF